jgi:hypothetical protein
MSKYRENPNLRPREYRHEPTRYHDSYPKWMEALLKSEQSLAHLLKPKGIPPYELLIKRNERGNLNVQGNGKI